MLKHTLMNMPKFVPSQVWQAENFSSRKHMKDTMYDRAKVRTSELHLRADHATGAETSSSVCTITPVKPTRKVFCKLHYFCLSGTQKRTVTLSHGIGAVGHTNPVTDPS